MGQPRFRYYWTVDSADHVLIAPSDFSERKYASGN